MPNPERRMPEGERTRLIPKLPEANIEPLEDETTESAKIATAEAGTQSNSQESTIKVARKTEQEIQAKAHEDGRTIAMKKLEAGMDPEVLREGLEVQLEDIDETIEDLEESGDQPVMLDSAYMKREQLLAGIKALDDYEKGRKEAAA